MKKFEERCAEPIVERVSRYSVVPKYIEGMMLDIVKRGRYEGFDHYFEFQCTMDKEKLKPQTDLLQGLDSEDDISERYISEMIKKLEESTPVKRNYNIKNLDKVFTMTKKEYESPNLELFKK